ncbi:MAG: pirin family protein [Pseudomonadota bacterium]
MLNKSGSAILDASGLGFPWVTVDPFLFCAHHDDRYPRGNAALGPDASLAGRDLGQDFGRKDGWSMYHGRTVPGFPAHPHRGFETVTIVRRGLIDHSDSLGAAARFGGGDVQWLTTGRGIVHSEMFPLLDRAAPNPVELFQIWLNLPARSKMADPHFTMFWSHRIPSATFADAEGRRTRVCCVAGRVGLDGIGEPPAPPPQSWAADASADVAIWTLAMEPGSRWVLPPASDASTGRTLYFFSGASATVDGTRFDTPAAIRLKGDAAVELVAGGTAVECLLLQGRPIGETVARYGPFVMNTRQELQQAFEDYQRTSFGGWPWPDDAPVHGTARERFARHPDGRVERPEGAG